MSDAVKAFTVTIPANTTLAEEFKTPLGLANVEDILIVVPPGPAGLVGFQIWAGGSPAYPLESDQYFIFDDYTYDQAVSSQIDSGQWSIYAYNTDVFDHILHVYYRYNYVTYSPSPSLSPVLSV